MIGGSNGSRANVGGDGSERNDRREQLRRVRTSDASQLQDGKGRESNAHIPQVSVFGRTRKEGGRRARKADRRGARSYWQLYCLVILGWSIGDLNPLKLADKAWNAVVGGAKAVGNDIKSLVKSAVDAALSTVESWVRDALGDVESAVGQLFGSIQNIDTQIENLAKKAGGVVEHGVGDVLGDAEHYADEAVADLASTVHAEINGIKSAVSDVEKGSALLESWATQHILDPIDHWISGASKLVMGWIADWWRDTYNDVVKPIAHDLEAAEKDVAKASEWIAHEGIETAEIVAKCADWLAWFALNPIAGAEDALNDLVKGLSLSDLESISTPAPELVSAVSDSIAELLK